MATGAPDGGTSEGTGKSFQQENEELCFKPGGGEGYISGGSCVCVEASRGWDGQLFPPRGGGPRGQAGQVTIAEPKHQNRVEQSPRIYFYFFQVT